MRHATGTLLLAIAVPGLVQLQAQQGDFRPASEEQAFLDLLSKEHRPIEAKEAARTYLAVHPNSFLAFMVIGSVCLETDGDLPRADYYLRKARLIMEQRYREPWANGGPWRFYASTLMQLFWTYQGLERHEDAIAVLKIREDHFWPKRTSFFGWPLMKLGRIKEAREKIAEALAGADPNEVENALNTLGAIEGESDHPELAYEISTRLYALNHKPGAKVNLTFVRNHGEHAWKLGRPAEAERNFLEATEYFDPYRLSNPWKDLACLYLDQQRFPETLDAVKKMQSWAYRSHPLLGLENWNYRQAITACLLMYCGYTDESLRIVGRLVDLPDRHGHGSTQADLWTSGSLIFYYQVLQDTLARDEESLSYARWKERPLLWAQRIRHSVSALSAARRGARIIMANPGWLSGGLRVLSPTNPVSVQGGEYLLPEIVGSGVVEAEIRLLLSRTGAALERERGFLLLFLGSARLSRGDAAGALVALAQAEQALPAEFALERTQLSGLRAKALGLRGDRAQQFQVLQTLMSRDAGAVRRFRLKLPCRIEASGGPAASKAAALLANSPRLEPGQGGFRVVVTSAGSGLQGRLDGPGGDILCRFRVNPGADADSTARDFCRLFHQNAFRPRIDLSQRQINSLSGSTLAADNMNDQLKGLLDTNPIQKP